MALVYKYRRKSATSLALLAAGALLLLWVSDAGAVSASSRRAKSGLQNDAVDASSEVDADDSAQSASSSSVSQSSPTQLTPTAPTTPACLPSCLNGKCVNGKCECYPGWKGPGCGICGGKIKLTSTKGWLADAVGNYSVDSKCTWLIEAPDNASTIRLHLKEFATECGWDHLYIFDGNSIFSNLKAVYSGLVRQELYQVQKVPELVGTSGSMLVHFYSDVAYNMTGFNITFNVDSCPSEHHGSTCSGHGSCDANTGKCACDPEFTGPACSVPACPNNCETETRERHGTCDVRDGRGKRCHCDRGYTGPSCSQSVAHGFWRVLTPSEQPTSSGGIGIPAGRTSHAAMVDEFGKMWVIGGETFSKKARHMVASYEAELHRLDTDLGSKVGWWKEERAKSDKGPSARYGHSAVLHDRKIYMYGGTLWSGHISKELWALDLDQLSWEREETSEGQCGGSHQNKLCGPIHSMGHTANVVSNRMIVIFGHSPKYGYLDTVQEYHFGNKEWSVVGTTGYPVKGGFGHTSVWDQITQKIYVYGGFVSTASSSAAITDKIYSYDPVTSIWKLHTAAGSFRYLHSAVASNGLMIVFGGNTHNDTSTSHGAKCYSADLIVYDIVCDRWHNIQDSIPKELNADLARFGHSAVMHNGTMLLHGGFHGVLKNDLLAYVPGQCQMYKDRDSCLKSFAGVKCVWESKKRACEAHPRNRAKSSVDTCLEPSVPVNHTALCASLSTCESCVSTSADCGWCNDKCTWKECSSGTGETKKGKRYTKLEECQKAGLADTPKDWCDRLHKCQACTAYEGCHWDMDKSAKCREAGKRKTSSGNLTGEQASGGLAPTCSQSCSEHTSCTNCTHGLCMWCQNLNMCIDRNAYLASFPYGQCMDWTTHANQCHWQADLLNVTFPENLCSTYQECSKCRANPSCGWCDDGSNSGLGSCTLGGDSGPLKRKGLTHNHYEWVKAKTCQPSDGLGWHFTTCPACQCNGHSVCGDEPGVCNQPCKDHTEGEHCERCSKGFFGTPINGGTCKACMCNNQASECNHHSGKCHCTTKGIIGDHCERCDKVNHYYGDPMKESCFYDLAIDYQFTFNLSKSDDKHFTAINFKNEPTKLDVDVDFSISCSVPARMNLTYRFGKDGKEMLLFSNLNCSSLFKERFSKDDYVFGESENTTFYVYVYDFEPPLWIIISFSQHPKLNLLQFFITFSSCFLALLLVAAILWKIKQRYDRYRRRQRLFVEMEQMASRPFGAVIMELERIPEKASASTTPAAVTTTASSSSTSGAGAASSTIPLLPPVTRVTTVAATHNHPSSMTSSESGIMLTTSTSASGNLGGGDDRAAGDPTMQQQQQPATQPMVIRKRKRRYRPSPIALEPCESQRAAVLSLIVRLPTGGKPYAPPGYTGIAVASSLVTLGNPRKPSADVTNRPNVDDVKGRKGRKGPNAQPADI